MVRFKFTLIVFSIFFPFFLIGQVNLTTSSLPIIYINTNQQEIPDEPKITADMGVIYQSPGKLNHADDPWNHYDGKIGIELRGSTSQWYEKKAYSIETRDVEGEDYEVSLFDMPEESDWVLISPLNDKSLMRDALAHTYAGMVLPWSPRSQYVELILNGAYQGVYLFLESIKRDKNRVDINNLKPDEVSGDDLTGGYLLRIDKDGPTPGEVGGDWLSPYPPAPGAWQETWFQYRDPKADEIASEQASYIQSYIGDFEWMLQSGGFAEEYLSWIDLDSWVDYLLVQELCKNSDAYRLSAYFYKQRDSDGGKIFMGPEWDFNIAFGLGDYCEGDLWTGWVKDYNEVCPNDTWLIHFWWARLWSEEKFRHRVVERWQEHRNSKWSDENLFGIIDSLVHVLELPQQRNFDRWPVFGEYVWPNAFVGDSYTEEINYLRNWFVNRLEWLDAEIPLLSVASFEPLRENKVKVYPNPTSDMIYFQLPDAGGDKWFYEIYNLSGQRLLGQSLQRSTNPSHVEFQSYLPAPGFYLLHLISETGYHTAEKFSIE
jgi:hypothetical protein